MKNKVLKAILWLLCMVGLTSCNALLAPEHAKDNNVRCRIYDEVSKQSKSDFEEGLDLFCLVAGGSLPELTVAEKIQNTKMLEWSLNEQMLGDTYTGYFITYEVQVQKRNGSVTYYALVDFTEFDSGKWQFKVLDVDESLSEIQSWLY